MKRFVAQRQYITHFRRYGIRTLAALALLCGVPLLAAGEARLTGRTVPAAVAEVRPQTNGVVAEICFVDGAEVAAGDVLFRLDASLYEMNLLSARAARADALAAHAGAEAAYARSQRLFSARQILDIDMREARAVLEKAAAEARLKVAEFELEQTRIRSPLDGRVGKPAVSVGMLATRDRAAPLAVMTRVDAIHVEFEQPVERGVALLRSMGADPMRQERDREVEAVLLLPDGTAYVHAGTPLLSRATIDADAGVLTFRAAFPNPDHLLMPGMTVACLLRPKGAASE